MSTLPKTNKRDLMLAGRRIHDTGFGTMGLTWNTKLPSQEQAFAVLKTALDSGANFWNAGEIYGTPERNSLHLLNEYFSRYPEDAEKVVLSVKGGMIPGTLTPDGSPENTRRSIEECVRVLNGKKTVDIWEAARVDQNTPIETTMREASLLASEGKIGGIGLSECSADTIRRASKVAPITCVEVEFSLWSTEVLDNGVSDACAELQIPIVAYSPMGKGFLTGQIKSLDDIPEGDMRRLVPRFQPQNFDQNLKLVEQLKIVANNKGCQPSQLALAWVRAKGNQRGMPTFIPIPGSSSPTRVKENLVEVSLGDNDLEEISQMLHASEVTGDRAAETLASLSFGSTPPL